MSNFWSLYITLITLGTIAGCTWLLLATRKIKQKPRQDKTTGHSHDGIEEYDNPLPRWWLYMFFLLIIFSLIYLVLYPGLGNFKGLLGWTSTSQYEQEVQAAEQRYGPIFARYAEQPITELVYNPQALEIGKRLFLNNCSLCHGSDARGAYGFPNLTNNDWLYGGTPKDIVTTITEGRNGQMPGWQNAIRLSMMSLPM
jgi:cytochrome c oxidase cbb3-type subunit 3